MWEEYKGIWWSICRGHRELENKYREEWSFEADILRISGTVFNPRKDKNKQDPWVGFAAPMGGILPQQAAACASLQSICTLMAHHDE